MSQIKIATFNVEWMISVFGGLWKQWDGTIPQSFPGKSLGAIKLEAIEDVPALCRRIAGVIADTGADIIGIQEGPPRKDQMEVFVRQYLNDDYVVFTSNANQQAIHALVRRSIAGEVTAFEPDAEEVVFLKRDLPFYAWGDLQKSKKHGFDRIPLVLTYRPSAAKSLRILVVHTKSKYSKLTKELWEQRDPAAVADALLAREKLSAEVMLLRQYIDQDLAGASAPGGLMVMGDMNDGPYAEQMEREFLIHNIVDELVGSFLKPDCLLKHAMTPQRLSQEWTVEFPDPLENGRLVTELIDQMVLSPSIWRGGGAFRLKKDSCKVERQAYDAHDDSAAGRTRGNRPSDHRPVSVVFQY